MPAALKKPAADMSQQDWKVLARTFIKWIEEEAAEPEHANDEATLAAGMLFLTPENEGLFVKRAADSPDHPGEWCLPGGLTEDGETPEATARREASEELGFPVEGDCALADRVTSDEGIDFATFIQRVPQHFTPELNNEHTEYAWAPLDSPPTPMHPGVSQTLHKLTRAKTAQDSFAFDRSSVRTYDKDGRLHVALTNISKAAINPYLGREIPDYESLGLEPDRVYKLFRDPDELAKGAASFNNLPLLGRHIPVSAADPQQGAVIGSTGTDSEFDGTYLQNSLVVWVQDAIDAIEEEKQKELSSAYRYRADMTPGKFEGEAYDGVMRDIVGNHVALVKEGRAGSDVVVGDSNEELQMKKIVPSRRATAVQGALLAFLTPKLAQDAKIDVRPLVAGLTAKNFKDKKAGIVTGVTKLTEGKLAKDASLGDLVGMLDTLEGAEGLDEEPAAIPAEKKADDDADVTELENKTMDAGGLEKVKEMLRAAGVAEEVIAQIDGLMAADEDNDEDGKKKEPPAQDKDGPEMQPKDVVTKPAMDAAIKAAAEGARKLGAQDAQKIAREMRSAEKAVHPYVGELAMDSIENADQVYEAAFKVLGVDVAGVHASAYPAILKAQPVPGAKKASPSLPAMDGNIAKNFAERFPDAQRIRL